MNIFWERLDGCFTCKVQFDELNLCFAVLASDAFDELFCSLPISCANDDIASKFAKFLHGLSSDAWVSTRYYCILTREISIGDVEDSSTKIFFIVALVGTFELYLFVLFVALLFPAAVGDALPAEGVPAVLEGEVGPYYVLAEDALRVDLLVYLVYLVLALLDHLDVAAELDRLVAEVYLVGELSLPVLRLEGFCYLEDLV